MSVVGSRKFSASRLRRMATMLLAVSCAITSFIPNLPALANPATLPSPLAQTQSTSGTFGAGIASVVPDGICGVTVAGKGGGGASSPAPATIGGAGGSGATINATFKVLPGQSVDQLATMSALEAGFQLSRLWLTPEVALME